MGRVIGFIGTVVFAANCGLAHAASSEDYQKVSAILSCVRGIYQVTTLKNTPTVPMKDMIDIVEQTLGTKSDLDILLSECESIRLAQFNAAKGNLYPLTGVYETPANFVKKQKAWHEAFFAVNSKPTDEAYALLRIIEPVEKCEPTHKIGGGLILYGGASTLSCVNTAGFSYYRIEASAGAGLSGGCMAIGYVQSVDLLTYPRGDDWSWALNFKNVPQRY